MLKILVNWNITDLNVVNIVDVPGVVPKNRNMTI